MASNPHTDEQQPELRPNEARTITEYSNILKYWDTRDADGVPRGIVLDDQVIQEIPAMHKIVFGTVKILTHQDAGQIYKQPEGGYGINAGVYFSIAQAAGISFPDEMTRIDASASRFPDRVVAKAASLRTDLAGQPQLQTGMFTLDIDTKCDRQRTKLQNERREDGKPKWTPEQIEAEVLKLRYNLRESGVQRAITGAQRAALKAQYGKLRRKWRLEDFALPLIIPRLVVDMNAVLDTREGRLMLSATATGFARTMAFGASGRGTLAGLLAPAQVEAPAALPAAAGIHIENDDDDEPIAAASSTEVTTTAAVTQPISQPADLPETLTQKDLEQAPLPTAVEYSKLPDSDQVRLLDYVLATRQHKPVTKKAEDLDGATRTMWYERLLDAPLLEAAP